MLNEYEQPEMRRTLDGVRIRITQLKMLDLGQAIERIRAEAEVPIELSPTVDRGILKGRFGMYADFLGYHPSALAILSSIGFGTFSSPVETRSLTLILEKDRARLVSAEEAEAHWSSIARKRGFDRK